jgi:hypothetical protein
MLDSPSLNLNVLDSDIESAYRGMAQIILELSKPTFTCIGALVEEGLGVWKVVRRLLTLNMNEQLLGLSTGNIPILRLLSSPTLRHSGFFSKAPRLGSQT